MAKIAFIHYRSGERDGVSLEIEKRKKVLEELGHEVLLISGFDPRFTKDGAEGIYCIPNLDIKKRLAAFLRETCFQEKILDNTLAWLLFHFEEGYIYERLSRILQKTKPDLVFVHNIFSHAFHLPATRALVAAFETHSTKVVAVHHDFFWERFFFNRPKYRFIADIIANLPPKKDFIVEDQVINSLAKEEFEKRRGVKTHQIQDYFDFSQPLPEKDAFNGDLPEKIGAGPNDLIILQATRITERKTIENAILFASELQKAIAGLRDGFAFSDKEISCTSKVFLLLPNFIEAEAIPYFRKLKLLAEDLEVNFVWLGEQFSLNRHKTPETKLYSFWDAYTYADLVTYTSALEGYGNQLLEAMWAKKLLVNFEYPVFTKDIKALGLKLVSLGNKMVRRNGLSFVPGQTIARAASETLTLLRDEDRLKSWTEFNFQLAKKNNDISLLREDLERLLLRA